MPYPLAPRKFNFALVLLQPRSTASVASLIIASGVAEKNFSVYNVLASRLLYRALAQIQLGLP